ncbi:MAG: hypothetical protein NT010_04990 [Proteobacteria bacterium]|nr:hypothetical protein [Pseudomonadota bacterium]
MNMLCIDMKVAGNHIITKILNIVLPLAGIAFMLFYEYCNTSCLYLNGTFIGINLKWVGIIYMIVLFASTFSLWGSLAQMAVHFRTVLISAAVGVEFFLISWQIVKGTYCPFCLAFSACIFLLFAANFSLMNKKLVIVSLIVGFAGFALFFEGSLSPVYTLRVIGICQEIPLILIAHLTKGVML